MITLAALICFAANSLLCRHALGEGLIDPATFTTLRLVSGAAVLWWWAPPASGRAVAPSLALLIYAGCFSFAYLELTAATGALLLFAAVQVTMLVGAKWRGERLSLRQGCGLTLALGGVVFLLAPGLATPPTGGAILMVTAGVAWGVYSLGGHCRSVADHFTIGAALAVALGIVIPHAVRLTPEGLILAVVSGAITSGLGYVLWFRALKGSSATAAAAVQLSVPVLAAAGGTWLLSESFSPRLLFASVTVFAGIALTLPALRVRGWEWRSVSARRV